jgi:hypothetical protein
METETGLTGINFNNPFEIKIDFTEGKNSKKG